MFAVERHGCAVRASSDHNRWHARRGNHRRQQKLCCAAVFAFVVTYSMPATHPVAQADPQSNLRESVAIARNATCAPLNSQPAIERAAQRINESTDDYYRHVQPMQPISATKPALEEAGYDASKATALFGYGANETDAIHGAVLEGFSSLPDCSYTDFGVSVIQNTDLGYTMTTIVLATPAG